MRAITLAFGFSFLFLASFIFSEPYLAVREGLKCSACHVNQTGGGKRTRMGTGYGAQDLPWKTFDLESQEIPHYWSFFKDRLSVGADFRVLNRSTFPDDDRTNTFQTDKSTLYLQLNLLPDFLTFYLDESIAPGGAQSRELFALIRNLPGRGYVKAGKYVLPYGLRLEDDRAFVREATGFTFTNPDTGAEIGFEPGNWQFVASVTNGTSSITDDNADKQVISTIGYIHDYFRIGVSGAYNPGSSTERSVAGAWAGIKIGEASLLGEFDWIHDDNETIDDREQTVAHAEINYPVIRGWNVKLAYEYLDPNRDVAENERDRFVVGVEPFLTPFLQIQLFYRFNQSIPQNEAQNADDFTLRLHIYF